MIKPVPTCSGAGFFINNISSYLGRKSRNKTLVLLTYEAFEKYNSIKKKMVNSVEIWGSKVTGLKC